LGRDRDNPTELIELDLGKMSPRQLPPSPDVTKRAALYPVLGIRKWTRLA
jgi:hypothetical protein